MVLLPFGVSSSDARCCGVVFAPRLISRLVGSRLIASVLLAVVALGSLLFVNSLIWCEKHTVGFFPHCPSKACAQSAFGLELVVNYSASGLMS